MQQVTVVYGAVRRDFIFVNSPPTRRQWEAFQLFKQSVLPPFMLSLSAEEAAAELNACFHGYQVQIFPPRSHIWLVAQETRSVDLDRSLALPWQPGEHKEAWNQRPRVIHFHSGVLRRLNHMIVTVIQLEPIQVQCDPGTSILQIRTWSLLTLLIEVAATTQSIFNEWMVHSLFHEAPLGNAIVHFKLHFVIMSRFSHFTWSYLPIDSLDVQAAFQGILEFHSAVLQELPRL